MLEQTAVKKSLFSLSSSTVDMLDKTVAYLKNQGIKTDKSKLVEESIKTFIEQKEREDFFLKMALQSKKATPKDEEQFIKMVTENPEILESSEEVIEI